MNHDQSRYLHMEKTWNSLLRSDRKLAFIHSTRIAYNHVQLTWNTLNANNAKVSATWHSVEESHFGAGLSRWQLIRCKLNAAAWVWICLEVIFSFSLHFPIAVKAKMPHLELHLKYDCF